MKIMYGLKSSNMGIDALISICAHNALKQLWQNITEIVQRKVAFHSGDSVAKIHTRIS